MTTLETKAPGQVLEKLAYTGEEFCALTGLSEVTRWRLEKRGLLKCVPGVSRKLYTRKAIEAFLDGKATAS